MKSKHLYVIIFGILVILFICSFPCVSADVTVPDPPQNLTFEYNFASNYSLSWEVPASDGGSEITGYKIEKVWNYISCGPYSSCWEVLVEDTESTDTNYVHEITGAYVYNYRVSAINSEGVSLPSNYGNLGYGADVPQSISTLSLTPVSDTQIDISWDEPIDNGLPITGYKIEYKVNGTEYVLVEDTSNNETTYSHTGLTPETLYYYKVHAINAVGESPAYSWDSEWTLEGSGEPTVPGRPFYLSVSGYCEYNYLNWQVPGDGGSPIIGYKIEYQLEGSQVWDTIVENTNNDLTTYLHTEATPDVDYIYRVAAINLVGVGESISQGVDYYEHSDRDCDGFNNSVDNCPDDYNPNQEDKDNDGVGDVCDNCNSTYNPTQEDDDNDGIGDACDTPGFELIIVIIGIAIVLFWKKNKKEV